MDNEAYLKVKKEYDNKRENKIAKAEEIKKQIYIEHPKLRELETQRNLLAIKITKEMLYSDELNKQIAQDNMQLNLENIDKKIERELKEAHITKFDLEPKFDCQDCKDTGLIVNNGNTEYCSCFLQKVINETYKQTNIAKLDEENFETFDLGFYSNNVNFEKYGIGTSPRQNIEKIKNIALEFVDNVDNPQQKNLLFVGNTGLGKTFLANAIAKKILDHSKSVIYQTAPIFMDKIMEFKFSQGSDKSQYYKIFDVDLLIIDDLGTETMTNNKYTELFNIINTRLLNNKKILISTNLTLNELYERYDERVISRLIGEFRICKFIGDDIRLKKKRISSDKNI
ncbi:MAG: ATP-binding protein [Clostridia bacterium]|nr:ATP-binding protein [Clostridia bacterium]